MGRRFARGSQDSVNFTAQPNFDWTFGTIVVCIRPASNPAAVQYFTLADIIASTDDRIAMFRDGDAAGRVSTYNGTGGAVVSGGHVLSTSSWQITGMSRASGTTTSRFHTYTWTTNTWAHTNAGATDVNPALTATAFRIGNDFASNGVAFADEDFAAVMWVPGWVPTDSEFERLAAGSWDRYVDSGATPGFLVEFPSGRDQGGTTLTGLRSVGRIRATGSLFTGTMPRSDRPDPPGFRFSRLTRRR